MFVWSLGSSLAIVLLGVLNVLRAKRQDDKALALITAPATACWLILALLFGKSIGNMLDPRVVVNAAVAAFLVAFSAATLRHKRAG